MKLNQKLPNSILLFFTLILLASTTACKSKKSSNNSIQEKEIVKEAVPPAIEETKELTDQEKIMQKEPSEIKNTTYDLVLSFYSIGSGSNWDVIAEIDKFLERFNSNDTTRPKVERVSWGREGEVDFCIALDELSSANKLKFLEEAKLIANKAKFVHINENAPCRNKRK